MTKKITRKVGKVGRSSVDQSDENGSGSLKRGLDMINLLWKSPVSLRPSEIVKKLNIPRSSGYGLIRTLIAAEFIERDDNITLRLGRQLHCLGMAYRERVDLLKEGAISAEALRDETGETVQMCVLDNEHVLILLKEDGKQPIRIISTAGTRVPVNWAASGRLLVSDFSDEKLRDLLNRTAQPSRINRKPVRVDALIKQIREFRTRGWAFEINETNEHAGCVAAPVLDSRGHCIATLSVVVPEYRLKEQMLPSLVKAVKAATAQLSRRLGTTVAANRQLTTKPGTKVNSALMADLANAK